MEYIQSTGEFFINGVFIERGFAGRAGMHQNNPASQCIISTGPLPVGKYKMADAKNYKTEHTIRLIPYAENDMCNPPRAGFLIHGDSRSAPGTGSEGCIILSKTTRQKIVAEIKNGNDFLWVR